MITITEARAKKVPGLTSFFIKFDYNQYLVDLLKTIQDCNYDKSTRVWEMPLLKLSTFLDYACQVDSITLNLLETDDDTIKQVRYKQDPNNPIQLFHHQEEAVDFGLNHADRWLLLDAPGLGKTLSLIRLAEELKKRDNIEHCLVICGINTLKANWKREIQKFSKLDAMILGERTTRTGKKVIEGVQYRINQLKQKIDQFFVIVNVETLRSDDVVNLILKGPNKFDFIIVDEIHTCKSPNSQQGKNLLKTKSKYEVGATGTLLLNNPLDCYVPLKWIGAENSSLTNFRYYYCEYGGTFNNVLTGYKNVDQLKYQLEKIALRRKKDLLDLPPKTVITEYVVMEPDQQQFYDNIKKGIVDQVDKVKMSTANLLAMVTRLRQATSCPQVLTTETISSAKVDRCVDLVQQILTDPDEKVVVFCQFKDSAEAVCQALAEYKPLLCTGDVDEATINSSIDIFQNSDDYRVLVATMAKMGTGVTLNRAHYAIFVEQAWTDGVQLQCEDRVHRIGTNQKVFIYRLVTLDTIDERVIELLQDKKAISDYVVDDAIPMENIASLQKYIQELTY